MSKNILTTSFMNRFLFTCYVIMHAYTANSMKFDIDNNERCNMSDQRISQENAVSNKISTMAVLQDNKYSI